MQIILSHIDNYNIVRKLHYKNHKVIVIGQKNPKWFFSNNISFMSLYKFIKTYKNKNINSILILDKINYLHPESLNTFKKLKYGVFSGSNLRGDDELYLFQVMGKIPYVLSGPWHDNYMDKCFYSTTDLGETLLENFMSEMPQKSNEYNFNQYRTDKFKSVVYTKENIFKYIKNNKIATITELLTNFRNKYIKSGCWYLIDENENITNRLYKH